MSEPRWPGPTSPVRSAEKGLTLMATKTIVAKKTGYAIQKLCVIGTAASMTIESPTHETRINTFRPTRSDSFPAFGPANTFATPPTRNSEAICLGVARRLVSSHVGDTPRTSRPRGTS